MLKYDCRGDEVMENGEGVMRQRQYEILKMLYNSEGFVTVEYLAEEANCSLKTIRNDLKILGNFLVTHKLGKIISKSNKGVCLEKDKDWIEAEYIWNEENQIRLYSQEKRLQVLELLLKQRGIQKLKLEQNLLLSRLDADKAVIQAQHWLEEHDITVTIRRGQGIQIECTEFHWRMAMWALFSDISRKQQEFTSSALKMQMESFLWGFDLAGVKQSVSTVEELFGFHYSFDGYRQLLFLLALCVIRTRKREQVELPFVLQYEGMKLDQKIARICVDALEKYYQITLSELEMQFAIFAIGISEIQEFTDDVSRQNYQEENQEVGLAVDKVISVTGNILGQNLESDDYLYNSLVLFTKFKVLKLKYGLKEENPLKEIVKTKYSNIYAAAWSASHIIESDLGIKISEHEVAYLALYIGGAIERLNVGVEVCILCNHGIGISRILKEQIERSIQNINILDVLTTRDILKIQKSRCDFLISAVPVGSIFAGKDVVEIGNVLQTWDIQLIQNKMKQIRKHKMRKIASKIETPEYHLFHKSLVYHFTGKNKKNDLITFLCKQLEVRGYVTADYVYSVFQREQTTSTALEHGVAIPHGTGEYICQPVIAVAILDEPMEWGGKGEVDRIFLLALNLDDNFKARGRIIRFYSAIVALLDDKEAYDRFHMMCEQEKIANFLNSMVEGEHKK